MLTAIAPATFSLAVGTGPLTEPHALRIAAEQWAFGGGPTRWTSGWTRELTQVLLGATSCNADLTAVTPENWTVSLND